MVMEAFERGVIDLTNTDGIEMRFGNDQALLEILEKIGKREDLGDILAQGLLKASQILNIEEFAIHSKGQSFPVYDPRGAKGMALTYATSPKGAHHMLATTFGTELAMGNRFEIEGKALLERDQQFSMAIVDSITMCSTMRAGIPLENQAKAYRAVTGIKVDNSKLLKAAERIINLERMYNVKLGFDRTQDSLPDRFINEPMPSGESKGQVVELKLLLDDYYTVMGWDTDGIPTKKKLKELDLIEYV
jgi:aldehyde:ferredoxin oxidoreductase